MLCCVIWIILDTQRPTKVHDDDDDDDDDDDMDRDNQSLRFNDWIT